MAIEWSEVAFHAVPTAMVGIGFGFVAGFGLNSPTQGEMTFWLAAALLSAMVFSMVWFRREQRQHDGHLGGLQSKLEAIVPAVTGMVMFAVSTLVFWKLDL